MFRCFLSREIDCASTCFLGNTAKQRLSFTTKNSTCVPFPLYAVYNLLCTSAHILDSKVGGSPLEEILESLCNSSEKK